GLKPSVRRFRVGLGSEIERFRSDQLMSESVRWGADLVLWRDQGSLTQDFPRRPNVAFGVHSKRLLEAVGWQRQRDVWQHDAIVDRCLVADQQTLLGELHQIWQRVFFRRFEIDGVAKVH